MNIGIVRRLIDLVLFRCGPQDLPGNQSTLIATAVAYCIAQFAQIGLLGAPTAAFVQAILATILLGLYAAAVLRIRKLSNRLHQTGTALFGTGSLLTLAMLPATWALLPYLESIAQAQRASDITLNSPLAALAYVIIGIWGLAVYSHIYRHALDVSIALAIGVTIGFEALVLVVFSVLG
ncbi:hypothetical protein [Salinisphaera japonica]|uniref:hypothetical protein n=1 Tax=Salinisphaera japonica TaxID=1304270 RepID=UPI000F4C46DF|nr:hypothetical protein [Salinisphaera japonica]